MRAFVVSTLVCALFLGSTAPASARKMDVGADLLLGMTGEVKSDAGSADLEVTAGFGLFADWEIWKYIDIGAHVNFTWWKIDGASDRDLFVDIGPYLKGKFRFVRDKLEIYGKFPIGFTLCATEDNNDKSDTDPGFHTGLLFGVSYNVFSGFWPFLELGWTFHWLNGEGSNYRTNQFALNLGASWAF